MTTTAAAHTQDLPSPNYPIAPAPWQCRGQAFWFLLHNSSTTPLPSEFHDPRDYTSTANANDNSNFAGGLGMIQVVRYTDTPVGPYDELLYIPGAFNYTTTTKNSGGDGNSKVEERKTLSHLRITRIYVSSEASIYNGRKNWNIPKHLAKFTFTANSITVSSPSSSSSSSPEPFFIATWKSAIPGMDWLKVPMSTSFSPLSTLLVQPPLDQVEGEEATEGTKTWKSMQPWQGGNVGLIRVEVASGIGRDLWPSDVGAWSIGLKWDDMKLEFPEPKELIVV